MTNVSLAEAYQRHGLSVNFLALNPVRAGPRTGRGGYALKSARSIVGAARMAAGIIATSTEPPLFDKLAFFRTRQPR